MHVNPDDRAKPARSPADAPAAAPVPFTLRWLLDERSMVPLAIVAIALLIPGKLLTELPEPGSAPAILGHAMIWLSLACGAVHGVRAGVESIRRAKPDIDLLMIIGAALAAWIGDADEGALLLFMFTLAGGLQHRALARAKDSVSRLTRLMPKGALIQRDGQWIEADPDELVIGDRVLVRPGELVPADGEVESGESALDQSTLTGESLPRSVQPGDPVLAGTLNQSGSLEVRVTRRVSESSLRKILRIVVEAQERRAPAQRIIDAFSSRYAIGVFVLSAAAFAWFLWGAGMEPKEAAKRVITLLIVASPCALVIATPTATLCALSRAARGGLLVKGGEALERLATVRAVALDKTGTLTRGKVEVVAIRALGDADEHRLLALAAALEAHSTHPIAAAIIRRARPTSHAAPVPQPASAPEIDGITNVPGRGLSATHRGRVLRVGGAGFAAEILPAELAQAVRTAMGDAKQRGAITAAVALAAGDGQPPGALVVEMADQPREGAEHLAQGLRDVGVERIAMLTGDHETIAREVAARLGITEVGAGLLPEDKVHAIERMKAQMHGEDITDGTGVPPSERIGGTGVPPVRGADSSPAPARAKHRARRAGVAVIGDGVNDAPALAAADVGLAMGGVGSDAALETADVIVLHDDLSRIPWAIGLARAARQTMIVNIAFAMGVIVVLVVLAAMGIVNLALGVVGHEGSTLVVVGNSLRLLWFRDEAMRGHARTRPLAPGSAAGSESR